MKLLILEIFCIFFCLFVRQNSQAFFLISTFWPQGGRGEGEIWTNDFHFIKHGPWLIVLSPGVQIFEDYNSHEHTIPAKVCSS